jgi:tetratricopeptide (TPR) repeat protein
VNVPLRNIFATVAVALVAALLVLGPVASGAAQDKEQDEALAYNAWFAANQAQDAAKAVQAAEAYLAAFPTGQYADFLQKWLGPARLTLLNEAIKAGDVDKMLVIGKKILAQDPGNLNVLYALAFQLRQRELLASPRSYAHAADAMELSQKAIDLVQSGKTLAGVQTFDKNATLAWLYQLQAMVTEHDGNKEKAIQLYEKSTSLDPKDPGIAARNLLELLAMRQSDYADAATAYNALPDEARAAAEPSPEVKAARERVDREADALIDVAARFVALAEVTGLPQATRDKVYGILESVYKSRHPEDANAAGLQALIDSKK